MFARALVVLGLCWPGWLVAADTSEDVFDLDNLSVKITEELPYIEMPVGGETIPVLRYQDPTHRIVPPYDQTARPCPPYCIQPMQVAPGVETVGELEVLDYMQRIAGGDAQVLLIDSRSADWVARGTIPGAIHIAYTRSRSCCNWSSVPPVPTASGASTASRPWYSSATVPGAGSRRPTSRL